MPLHHLQLCLGFGEFVAPKVDDRGLVLDPFVDTGLLDSELFNVDIEPLQKETNLRELRSRHRFVSSPLPKRLLPSMPLIDHALSPGSQFVSPLDQLVEPSHFRRQITFGFVDRIGT